MTMLGVDVGTTHCKAALFREDGALVRRASRTTPTVRSSEGRAAHDADALWETGSAVIREAAAGEPISAIGVASMAEAGLLLDRRAGTPRTPILAWFDTRSTPQSEALARRESPLEGFGRSGLHPSYKYGLSKILWLRDSHPHVTDGAVWLSVADYMVYRLTGAMATDPTLAARTYAYRIKEGTWDESLLRSLQLDPRLFPEVRPSGTPVGVIGEESSALTGVSVGTPVAVSGHDHICASLAAGIVRPGPMLDSIGTAESILAVTDHPDLGEEERASGLALVPHVLPGRFCWLGGLSAAGGSIEWLRGQQGDGHTFDDIEEDLRAAGPNPTGILYFPYLLGSGAPRPDRRVRAAFLGLSMEHRRGHLFKAVLEGTAFEVQSIRRAIERMSGTATDRLVAVGGGTQNNIWMQIKADVTGCEYQVPDLPEATALGAALTVALARGTVSGVGELKEMVSRRYHAGRTIVPDSSRAAAYNVLYESFVSLQDAVRAFGLTASGEQKVNLDIGQG